MGRALNVAAGLLSGYAAMIANILFSFASVPLALHFLSRQEFGLWALTAQVSNYLLLLDLGMSSSLARILIDHKDSRAAEYATVISTGIIVLVIQGLCVLSAGFGLALILPGLMQIPESLRSNLSLLIEAQCAASGLLFATRIFSNILQAHQRFDLVNLGQIVHFVANFAVLWAGFSFGLGVVSMVAASVAGMLATSICSTLAVWKLSLLPWRDEWQRPRLSVFFSLFSYAKDIFLMAVGWQLVSASQVIIITRVLGLDAAATWTIGTKVFTLAQQMVWRIYDFSQVAFSEMYVRQEWERLRWRFMQTVTVTASLSILVAVVGAACNRDFMLVWTGGKIVWPKVNDLLMGALTIAYSVNRCHSGFVGVTKDIRWARYVYLAEGVIFIGLAVWWSSAMGISGVILAALTSDLLLPGIYGLNRSKAFFGDSRYDMVINWLRMPARFLLLFSSVALLSCVATVRMPYSWRWIVLGVGLSICGSVFLFRCGLSKEIREELEARLRSLLKRRGEKRGGA